MRFTLFFLFFLPLLRVPAQVAGNAGDLLWQADSLFGEEHYEAAAELYRQGMIDGNAGRHWEDFFRAGYGLSLSLQKQGLLPEAIRLIETLTSRYQEEGLPASAAVGDLFHKLGVFHYLNDDYDQSQRSYEQAIAVRAKVLPAGDPELARSHHNLAVTLKEKGNYGAAGDHLERAVIFRRALGDGPALAASYQELGIINELTGDYNQAKEYHEAALAIFRKEEGAESYTVGRTFNELGIVYWRQRHFSEALDYFRQARLLFTRLYGEEDIDVANCYHNTGNILDDLNDHPAALAAFRQALAINRKMEDNELGVAGNLNNIGITLRKMGRYRESKKYLDEALLITRRALGAFHPDQATIYDNLGDLYLDQEQLPQALHFYQQAILHRFTDFRDTSFLANPELDKNTLTGSRRELLTTLASKASALKTWAGQQEDPSLLPFSLATFALCDRLIDQMRQEFETTEAKLFLLERAIPIYERAIALAFELYHRDGDPSALAAAFGFMEKSRAVVLLGSIKDQHARLSAAIPDTLLQRERAIQADIAYSQRLLARALLGNPDDTLISNLRNQLLALREDRRRLIGQLERDFPVYYREKYQTATVDLASLQRYLAGQNACLVEYFTGEEQLYIISVTATATGFFRIALDFPLAEQLASFLLTLSTPATAAIDPQQFVAEAHQLYQLLWQPLAGQLSQRVIISPYGQLAYLPFEALSSGTPPETDFRNIPYLIRRHQISYSYSATVLLEQVNTPHAPARKKFLGFAPTFTDSPNYASLPYSEDGLRQLQRLLGGDIRIGRQATREAFLAMAGGYRLLHLSSHASARDTAWIAFWDGQGSTDSSRLYLSDLGRLRLHAELGVLSACETGAGHLSRGEGVMSLARGLTNAGCRSTVTSLWTVNHQATSRLMEAFYRELAEGYPKDEALRRAKITYLDAGTTDNLGAHPFFWAAYILIGDADPLTMPRTRMPWALPALLLTLALAAGFTWWRKTHKSF